jgi:tricorn protease
MCRFAALTACALFWATSSFAAPAPGYIRFPAAAPGTVVFTAEGDLWTVPLSGGAARRLTSHPGLEHLAAVSPDGRLVAFTAQYEGHASRGWSATPADV